MYASSSLRPTKDIEDARARREANERAADEAHQKNEAARLEAESAHAEKLAKAQERRLATKRWNEANAARRTELGDLVKDAEYARPVLSFWICDAKARIKSYNEQMAEERRITAASGWQAGLKSHGVAPLLCDAKYQELRECNQRFSPGTFTKDEVRAMHLGKATHEELYDQHAAEQRCPEPHGTLVEMLQERLLM